MLPTFSPWRKRGPFLLAGKKRAHKIAPPYVSLPPGPLELLLVISGHFGLELPVLLLVLFATSELMKPFKSSSSTEFMHL